MLRSDIGKQLSRNSAATMTPKTFKLSKIKPQSLAKPRFAGQTQFPKRTPPNEVLINCAGIFGPIEITGPGVAGKDLPGSLVSRRNPSLPTLSQPIRRHSHAMQRKNQLQM